MAFELASPPNLNPQIPQQPDIMQKFGQMLALKNMMGQQKLLPLQVQEAQQSVAQQGIQTKMAQNKLASQQAMIKAWSDPEFMKEVSQTGSEGGAPGIGFDPNAMTSSLVKRGVLPEDAMQLTGQFVDRASKMSETVKNLGAAGADQISTYAKAHEQLANMLEPILAMPAAKASIALDNLKQKLLKSPIPGLDQTDAALINAATLDHLPSMVHMLGLDADIAKAAQAQASAEKAQEELPGGALSPVSVAEQEATNPQIQAGKIAVAKAEGEARGAIEVQVQNALKKSGNAALANVPPNLVSQATTDAVKAGTDYAQAQSVTQRLQQMMDAAKNGNVVSYQLIPQEGALQVTTSQGVHRINMAEIQNYGGGSLWQRMQGHLGKALTGKSIPESVLTDMQEMQKIQEDGSRSKYENTLKTINDAYGSTFKPVEMPTAKESGAALPSVTFKGKTYAPDELQKMGYKYNDAKHQWEK